MNRKAFFAALRRRDSGVFGTSLKQGQVSGAEAILDSAIRNGVTDPHHVANILGQVYHETGGRMAPVRETFATSDAQAISRLDTAFARGQLTWVKTPYWRPDADGLSWFGRGPIQLTHKSNYQRMGQRLGVNLAGNPSLALDPKIGADIAVVGMRDGMFTGRKLADYSFPAALNAPVASNPRRIVNGQDGTDRAVAGYHRAFHAAIEAAGGWSAQKPPQEPTQRDTPSPAPQQPKTPETPPTGKQGGFAGVIIGIIMAGLAGLAIYLFG